MVRIKILPEIEIGSNIFFGITHCIQYQPYFLKTVHVYELDGNLLYFCTTDSPFNQKCPDALTKVQTNRNYP